MSSTTKIEQNAVNEVRDYIDATGCLRSYLRDNDKTPLWDGSVFVYRGEPDKKDTLLGIVKAQVKGTEVEVFKSKESHRIERHELELYVAEGGLFFFVVEMLTDNFRERKIFYKKMTPVYIRAMLDSKTAKTIEIPLAPIPTDFHIVEDEMINFINDSRKQTSYMNSPGLSLAEALRSNYPIKAEGVVNAMNNQSLAMQLTSQPFYLYQETPHAAIPIRDIELTALATESINEPVSINGKTYFESYTKMYEQKTITYNIGDCFITRMPKDGYSDIPSQVEILYPNTGTIDAAINAAEFLVALKDSDTITFGQHTTPLTISVEDRKTLFSDTQHNLNIYRDIKASWLAMQIPGVFSFEDFDEEGLNQYLNVVQHVYRKEEGIPSNPLSGCGEYFAIVDAGRLKLCIKFTWLHDQFYASEDAFVKQYVFNEGRRYPILSAALANAPSILFDNIHYFEQLACYKECLVSDKSFMKVIKHDLQILKQQKRLIESEAKLELFSEFVDALKKIIYNEQIT